MALGTLPSKHSLEDDEEEGIFSEINITPLTDVFLVLLIIFMVTSTVITQNGVKVNLPKAGAASSISNKQKGVTISMNSEGKLFIDKKEVSLEGLEAELSARLKDTEEHSVILAGDREVQLGEALKVMDIAKKAGAERFGLATKSEK